MEREACVCDHGLERSDLCAEIIIYIFSASSHPEGVVASRSNLSLILYFMNRV